MPLFLAGDHKGSHALTDVSTAYTPGVYAISGFRPMLTKTRRLLDEAWTDDCIWTSRATGYPYPACMTQLLLKGTYESSLFVVTLLLDNSSIHGALLLLYMLLLLKNDQYK